MIISITCPCIHTIIIAWKKDDTPDEEEMSGRTIYEQYIRRTVVANNLLLLTYDEQIKKQHSK